MTVDLEHLEQLEQAATPGPWDVNDRGIVQKDGWDDVVVPGAVSCSSYCYGGTSTIEGDKYDADAELIVAARNALPELLADLRRERDRNAQVHDRIEKSYSHGESSRHADWFVWLADVIDDNTIADSPIKVAIYIESLRAANAELVEALRPFAVLAMTEPIFKQLSAEDFEQAAEVLQRHGGEG